MQCHGWAMPNTDIWMYIVSHFGAAALAAGCFLINHPLTGSKSTLAPRTTLRSDYLLCPPASQRVSMLPPKTVAASDVVDTSRPLLKLVSFAETKSTAAAAALASTAAFVGLRRRAIDCSAITASLAVNRSVSMVLARVLVSIPYPSFVISYIPFPNGASSSALLKSSRIPLEVVHT
jgi:hypothetical protein